MFSPTPVSEAHFFEPRLHLSFETTLSLDGLGLARQVINGGAAQLAAPMRLVAVKDGQEIEIHTGDPKLQRRVEAEADFRGATEAAGLRLTARTRVEFDGFVNIHLDVAPAGNDAAKVDKLYLEIALPAEQATHFCTTAGGVMTMMCQSMRHRTQWWQKHTHQFVGWVMAHDVLPEQVPLYPQLAEAGHLWADEVRFLPYWKPSPFRTKQADCLVSAHMADGRALLWVVNKSRKDADVRVAVDWKAIAMDPKPTVASNPETGAAVSLTADGFTVPVLQRDFVPLLLVPRPENSP